MILVDIELVDPNPYQTREIDTAHVADLAADIYARRRDLPSTRGLLQVPAARGRNHGGRTRYELVFGHHRVAAFRVLSETSEEYQRMPLEIVDFDEQQMAIAAWAENAQRSDLSVWEEANALSRLQDRFDWTQTELADHVGLSRSTVANKMRLLALPGWIVELLQGGDLSERQAMACLPVAELPEELLVGSYFERFRDDVVHGASSNVLRRDCEELVSSSTVVIESEPFFAANGTECRSCTQRVRARCANRECFARHVGAYREARLLQACKELSREIYRGLPEIFSFFGTVPEADCLACSQLMLFGAWESQWAGWTVGPDGFDGIVFYCPRKAKCRAERLAAASAPSAEDEARERVRRRALADVKTRANSRLAKDLASGRAWRAVLRALDFSADTAPRDAATTLDMIAARVMGRLVYGRTADPEQLAAEVERFFNVCVQTAVEY